MDNQRTEINGPSYDFNDHSETKPTFTIEVNPEYDMEFCIKDSVKRSIPILMCDIYYVVNALYDFAAANSDLVDRAEAVFNKYRVTIEEDEWEKKEMKKKQP